MSSETMTAEALYAELGHAIAAMPPFTFPLSPDALRWLGRTTGLVQLALGNIMAINFDMAAENLATGAAGHHEETIKRIVYRALGAAELEAPIGAQGAFIPAGSVLEGFAAIGKVMKPAKSRVLLVDPYADLAAVNDYASLVDEGVGVQILADQANKKPSLKPAYEKWLEQYGTSRPLEVRLAPAKSLHDRVIIVDETAVWSLGQSLNAFAARSHTTIMRIDAETSALKILAYKSIWDLATSL